MIRTNAINKLGFGSQSISAEWLVLGYFLFSLSVSIVLRANTAAVDGFFAELGNVSAALASGKGFADVFGAATGPTAWCPVLNVLCYAIVFKIFGVKSVAAFWTLIIFRCLLFSISLWWLLKLEYSPKFDPYKIWLVPIFLCYTTLVIYRTGPKDSMFSIFLSVFTIYVLVGCWREGISTHKIALFLLALLLPLASITLAIGVVILLTAIFIMRKSQVNVRNITVGTIALAVMFMSFGGWGLYNRARLGSFIPYKSNLWFEMYISNVVDQDGILKYSNYRIYHPYTNQQVAKSYQTKGEVSFLEEYHDASIQYLKQEPLDFITKVINRGINIFIFAKSERDIELASVEEFKTSDLLLLEKAGLIVDNYWVCLEQSPGNIQSILTNLTLKDQDLVFDDWHKKSNTSQARVNNLHDPNELIKGLITSVLPTLAIIFGLMVPGIRNNLVFLITLLLFVVSIGPYLVISWTPRYQSFQLGFFTIFLFMMLAQLLIYFNDKREQNLKGLK